MTKPTSKAIQASTIISEHGGFGTKVIIYLTTIICEDGSVWMRCYALTSGALIENKSHDSGWALMAIIGLDEEQKPIEIAAYCDDICWDFNRLSFKNDMFYPSGIIHFWSRTAKFKVGPSLSSTDIILIPK